MAKNGDTQNYRVPSQSAAYVKAATTITKQGASPQKSTGSDLRMGKSGK